MLRSGLFLSCPLLGVGVEEGRGCDAVWMRSRDPASRNGRVCATSPGARDRSWNRCLSPCRYICFWFTKKKIKWQKKGAKTCNLDSWSGSWWCEGLLKYLCYLLFNFFFDNLEMGWLSKTLWGRSGWEWRVLAEIWGHWWHRGLIFFLSLSHNLIILFLFWATGGADKYAENIFALLLGGISIR